MDDLSETLRITISINGVEDEQIFRELKPLKGADRVRKLRHILRRGIYQYPPPTLSVPPAAAADAPPVDSTVDTPISQAPAISNNGSFDAFEATGLDPLQFEFGSTGAPN